MEYREFNDYELLYMVKEESDEAYEILEKKYNPLIYKKAKEINKYIGNNGLEIKDLMQEGRIGLIDAIKNYNEDKNEFITFAYKCIENRIRHVNRLLNSNKNKTLNIAMDNNSIILDKGWDIDNLVGVKENKYESVDFKFIRTILNDEEYEVLILKIYGYSVAEVARIMNKTTRHIAYKNAFIKQKLEKMKK